MLRGVDVSYWEGKVNWQSVCAAGYRFAFSKATESITYFDATFTENINGAHAAAMPIGAYHFYRLAAPAKAQADFFISKIKSVKLDLPPVLDFEETPQISPSATAAALKTWLDIVEAATGRKPIIYTGLYFWENGVGCPSWANDYPLWIAQYSTAPQPHIPSCWNKWMFWQYTDKGIVPGCQGNVDLNLTSLSEEDLLTLAGMPLPIQQEPIVTPLPSGDTPGTLAERITQLEVEVNELLQQLKAHNIL